MNGTKKFHKATGPAFNPGEVWYGSGKIRVTIISVRKYAVDGDGISDYGVTYDVGAGAQHEKDAWSFQVRYTHQADLEL